MNPSSFKSQVFTAFPDILSKLSYSQQNEPSPQLLSKALLSHLAPAILIGESSLLVNQAGVLAGRL